MIEIGSDIRLPTEFGIIVVRHVQFRSDAQSALSESGGTGREGVIITTDSSTRPRPTLVRVQSSCLFGESLWATDCDCGSQLHLALHEVIKSNGLLLYLYEEGRGAGLKLKIDAISLQQKMGIETDEAFRCLNLDSDLRTYQAASEALIETLGPTPEIILLTNNPSKARGLSAHGIRIVETRKLVPQHLSEMVKIYLKQKRDRLGHNIDDKDLE